MKSINKYVKFIPVLCLFASIAMAEQRSKNPSDYTVVVLKDCEIVSKKPMTQDQLTAYLSLLNVEDSIESLHLPIQDVEDEINDLTNKIEEITELAIVETDDMITIDKGLLSMHQEIATQVQAIVDAHQRYSGAKRHNKG